MKNYDSLLIYKSLLKKRDGPFFNKLLNNLRIYFMLL